AASEELGTSTHAQWYESVVEGFERLHRYGDPVAVVGLSMGAVLAARLAADQGEAVAGVVMLSPAFFLPLWVRAPLKALRALGPLVDRIYLRGKGSDIHDAAARGVHPSARLMPLSAVLELLKLSAAVRPRLHRGSQLGLNVRVCAPHGQKLCRMERGSKFSYVCNRCGLCCRDKVITLSPYDVIRIARAARVSTGAVVAGYMMRRGSLLRFLSDGRCPAL